MKMLILPLTKDRRRVFVIPAKEVMVSFFFRHASRYALYQSLFLPAAL